MFNKFLKKLVLNYQGEIIGDRRYFITICENF